MRPLRYSIYVPLDGCCDHRAVHADEGTGGTGSSRRALLAQALAGMALGAVPRAVSAVERAATDLKPERRWYEAAVSMERLARSWGDQPYGAVLVAGGTIIGSGPSRVVKLGDPTAHAEREAIRDAQRRVGQTLLAGSVLYSTSRPCRACESAAAQAKVARMFHGPELSDAGEPQA
jgi:tRNA(Arg) A34 adenosine deaminase TadA